MYVMMFQVELKKMQWATEMQGKMQTMWMGKSTYVCEDGDAKSCMKATKNKNKA